MHCVDLTRFIQSLLPGTREWRRLKVRRRTKLGMFFRSWLPGIFASASDYAPLRPLPERTADDVVADRKERLSDRKLANVMAILNEYAARFNDNPSPVRLAALNWPTAA